RSVNQRVREFAFEKLGTLTTTPTVSAWFETNSFRTENFAGARRDAGRAWWRDEAIGVTVGGGRDIRSRLDGARGFSAARRGLRAR
ncbi:MAG: hypothetical protein ACREJ2_07555, partial [Planctomycetota bacterium]